MKYYVTSDLHLGETRFEIMARPFKNQMEHVNALIGNYNNVVGKNDMVFWVGDVCYKQYPEFVKYVDKFNGKKILIRGNHDTDITDEIFLKYFDTIVPEGQGITIEHDIPLYLTHYPTCGREDMFNLVGHIHSAWKYQKNMFNIGVDTNHFRPVDLDTIKNHITAISEYYDEDVWCSSNIINSSHNSRGKKGSYFVKSS